jgi:hypothetical protein
MTINTRLAWPALISASITEITCSVLPRPGSSASSPPPPCTALKSHRTPSSWCGLSTCARWATRVDECGIYEQPSSAAGCAARTSKGTRARRRAGGHVWEI